MIINVFYGNIIDVNHTCGFLLSANDHGEQTNPPLDERKRRKLLWMTLVYKNIRKILNCIYLCLQALFLPFNM